jgi:hypothetical protein
MIKACDHCHEFRQLTHRIKSDVLNMTVCYKCGVEAEIVQTAGGGAGAMSITLFEEPKVIPIWFECSICGGRFRNEHAYQNHWHEQHA